MALLLASSSSLVLPSRLGQQKVDEDQLGEQKDDGGDCRAVSGEARLAIFYHRSLDFPGCVVQSGVSRGRI